MTEMSVERTGKRFFILFLIPNENLSADLASHAESFGLVLSGHSPVCGLNVQQL